jgi:hypothetical protein
MRVPEQSYRGYDRASRVYIRIRKIRNGASDQGEVDPSGSEEPGPPRRLEQDPGGGPRLGRVFSEAGFEHPGELVDVPELLAYGVLEHTVEQRDGPARLGQGDPVHSRVGGETLAPPVGEHDLA